MFTPSKKLAQLFHLLVSLSIFFSECHIQDNTRNRHKIICELNYFPASYLTSDNKERYVDCVATDI